MSDVSGKNATDFQTISTCQGGMACRWHVRHKLCMSDLWSYGEWHAQHPRNKLQCQLCPQGCFEETALVEFRLKRIPYCEVYCTYDDKNFTGEW